MTRAGSGYLHLVTGNRSPEPDLRIALKSVASLLKAGDVPFALAGSYALWARGGPEPDHDVDFLVAEADAPAAAEVLRGAGLEVVHPPEDWLFKTYVDGALVDILFRANTVPVTHDLLDDADLIEVSSVLMPVMSATVLLGQRLNALEEHACDFTQALPVARAVREQVDWDQVRCVTSSNPYAAAFLFLLERLGVIARS